jgi:hypothetical protein
LSFRAEAASLQWVSIVSVIALAATQLAVTVSVHANPRVALNIHIYYHILVFDGVYSVKDGIQRFFHLKGPDDDDISLVVETIASKVIGMLREKKSFSKEGTEVDMPPCLDQLIEDSEQLKAAITASATMRIAFGENAGKKVRRVGHGSGIEEEHALVKGERCSSANGFTVRGPIQIDVE